MSDPEELSRFPLTFVDKPMLSPFFEVALYVAAGCPLAARAVNYYRSHNLIPETLPIRTSGIIPEGYGFMADGKGSGQILKFEERVEADDE